MADMEGKGEAKNFYPEVEARQEAFFLKGSGALDWGNAEGAFPGVACWMKMRNWLKGLWEAERDEFLGRGRYQKLDEQHDNYCNGYRPRKINLFGLGELELRVPRDRKGQFESELLPEGKGQDAELEAFLAEVFLAGCSTRDL